MSDQDTARAPEGRRVEALGDQLVEIHDMLRGELASLRRDLAGGGGPSGAPAPLDQQLRKKCLSFCDFLHGHHTAEDGRLLPGLAGSHPGLAPVLERLTREHVVVSRSLDRIRALLEGDDAAGVRDEVERLAEEVEAHLDYEEQQIVEALNSYGPVTL
jgi:hemerythrin-like domain-containing protein